MGQKTCQNPNLKFTKLSQTYEKNIYTFTFSNYNPKSDNIISLGRAGGGKTTNPSKPIPTKLAPAKPMAPKPTTPTKSNPPSQSREIDNSQNNQSKTQSQNQPENKQFSTNFSQNSVNQNRQNNNLF